MTVNRNTGGENGEGLNEMSKHQELACERLEDHPLTVYFIFKSLNNIIAETDFSVRLIMSQYRLIMSQRLCI